MKLPVAPLPRVDFPTIQVSASLPGASPETVATSVTTPLERRLGAIAGVTEITSTSTVGNARITLQFDLSRSIDGAARDVQAAINAARADLPSDLRSNPQYRKVNPADAPVLILALTSDTLGQGRLYDAASNVLQQKLSQVTGVGQVDAGRQLAAGGARRDQSDGAVEIPDRPGERARRPCRRQRQLAQGRDRGRRAALPDLHQRPVAHGRRVPAADHRLAQRRAGAAVATSPRSSTRPRTSATRARPTASARCW